MNFNIYIYVCVYKLEFLCILCENSPIKARVLQMVVVFIMFDLLSEA